eukprot:3250194-Pyramimonas_sp.AAC.2
MMFRLARAWCNSGPAAAAHRPLRVGHPLVCASVHVLGGQPTGCHRALCTPLHLRADTLPRLVHQHAGSRHLYPSP